MFPHDCEMVFEGFPELAQRALNSSNDVPSDASEMEVAVSIGAFNDTNPDASWEQCTEAATAGGPTCAVIC